jgi:hypothetical protein
LAGIWPRRLKVRQAVLFLKKKNQEDFLESEPWALSGTMPMAVLAELERKIVVPGQLPAALVV